MCYFGARLYVGACVCMCGVIMLMTFLCVCELSGITKDTLVISMKPEQWNAVIGLNLGGVFLASKAAASESSPRHSHQHTFTHATSRGPLAAH